MTVSHRACAREKSVAKRAALRPGDVVTIFEDPLTCTKAEGEATLVEDLENDMPPLQYWAVRFADDSTVYGRWIKPEGTRADA